ncbi:MAG: glutamate synthase [Candidatus Eisenbacteria bacterium]|nr:glutamate synthase [Candidatus Eisenbacteria bacterium]
MNAREISERILLSRCGLPGAGPPAPRKGEEEGGCGVVGLISSERVDGKHIRRPCEQMHNRGNGKGGGVAAIGLSPNSMGLSQSELNENYLIQIAFLDETIQKELEERYVFPVFDVRERKRVPTLPDFRELDTLTLRPPTVFRYLARVKHSVLEEFRKGNGLPDISPGIAEDEIVFQNSFRINSEYYASHGAQRAFVLCHGKDILVFKIVGYAEEALSYYLLDDLKANLWVGHQRYPTKGKVWHPGGAHPFTGLNEILVHNGDFANYFSVCEYLRQRNIFPLFLTDTEVSVLLFDLWTRVYGYPLEYVIEALAPTTERDFHVLPEEKKRIYRAIQASHIHGSPDGPWFFIVGRSLTKRRVIELLGITDTAMLRPQVFALSEGEVQVGLIASEKQAIDSALSSLRQSDERFCDVADKYWNARGGSHTDGGAFIFSLRESDSGKKILECRNKFGELITTTNHSGSGQRDGGELRRNFSTLAQCIDEGVVSFLSRNGTGEGSPFSISGPSWPSRLAELAEPEIARSTAGDELREEALSSLVRLRDLYFPQQMKRSKFVSLVDTEIDKLLRSVPLVGSDHPSRHRLLNWELRGKLVPPQRDDVVLFIDSRSFPADGEDSLAGTVAHCHSLGFRQLTIFGMRGQRFVACGLGHSSHGFRVDVLGSSGDYLGSGLDGADVYVHGSGQDQLGQILKRGTLVVYGDVGQTFMYGAKGGEAYVLGNAAGRPLINAVGRPRVVINGTCLDYLAEAFMAGDPLNGGGFVVINGITFTSDGNVVDLETPYPGCNLFSLASGGAIYIRDPGRVVDEDQLNGGRFAEFTARDWEVILPYLRRNESLFGISIEKNLLTFKGEEKTPAEVYRKVEATVVSALMPEGE